MFFQFCTGSLTADSNIPVDVVMTRDDSPYNQCDRPVYHSCGCTDIAIRESFMDGNETGLSSCPTNG